MTQKSWSHRLKQPGKTESSEKVKWLWSSEAESYADVFQTLSSQVSIFEF